MVSVEFIETLALTLQKSSVDSSLKRRYLQVPNLLKIKEAGSGTLTSRSGIRNKSFRIHNTGNDTGTRDGGQILLLGGPFQ